MSLWFLFSAITSCKELMYSATVFTSMCFLKPMKYLFSNLLPTSYTVYNCTFNVANIDHNFYIYSAAKGNRYKPLQVLQWLPAVFFRRYYIQWITANETRMQSIHCNFTAVSLQRLAVYPILILSWIQNFDAVKLY